MAGDSCAAKEDALCQRLLECLGAHFFVSFYAPLQDTRSALLPPLAGVECFWRGLVPAVSIRSTACYNLCSLREQSPPVCCVLREIIRPPPCASLVCLFA
jgi:hypothetical protein